MMSKIMFNGALLGLATILTALGVDTETFTWLGYLLFFDYVTGVLKAKTLGQSITSNKMKYGVISKFSIILIPLVLAMAAKGIRVDANNILYIGMNILILSETYSIIGNIYSIRTKLELPEYDAVAQIGHMIRGRLLKMAGEKIDD